MLVPVKWLKEYADINLDINEFADKMILSGSNIETVEELVKGFSKIVVGKIVKLEKHPEADKLQICQIDIGSEVIQIITGAQNVFEGAYIPTILDGGILPDGTKIKSGKLRGLESNGMLCSAKELGFVDKVIPTSHRDGIMILEEGLTLGQDILEAMDLKDEEVIEFEITPNRSDCLSIIGMARETAAVFPQKIRYPETDCKNETGDINDYISVEVKSPYCKRYVARAVKDIKIKPSPWWLQKRLIAAGVRPINNIVDATNYVMLEYGQPLHAFDAKNVSGNKIIVDIANEGQMFTTLDSSERTLTKDMLLINDGAKAVALAGVMGGLNSEIQSDTQTIIIESANFDADNVRATSKKLGLRTEASSRYEKGVDPNLCKAAADRACYLIELLGGGTVIKGAVDIYPSAFAMEPIEVRTARVNALLGIILTPAEVADMFTRLEIQAEVKGDIVLATPPTVRPDLQKEIDMVEEVARIYGYDNLPTTLPKSEVKGGKTANRILEDTAADTLIALGYSGIETYSFVSPKGVDLINSKEAGLRKFVKLINPLGEENSVMRTTLIPGMMEVLSRNTNRNIPEVRVFELGTVFYDLGKNQAGENLPTEVKNLLVGTYGPKEDFYAIKGVVVEMLKKIGVKELSFVPESSNETFHPGRCANIFAGEKKIGVMGEIHPNVAENYDMRDRVNLCALDFSLLCSISDTEKIYEQIPKFPAMTRDIALLVKEEITVGEMENLIKTNGKEFLEDIALFDIYRGKQVKEGYKSVAFSLRYRDKEKTLTEEAVSKVHSKVLSALKEQLDADLRDM